MLPKKNRLTKDKEFNNVFKNGRSSYTKILGFKAIKNNLNLNRFGIIVSKKVSKKAVERNKIKRQIRAIIKSKNLHQGYDIIVLALPKIINSDYKKIEQSIIYNLTKLRLLN